MSQFITEEQIELLQTGELTVIETKRFKDLEDSEWKLQCLENWGVDNWSGYDEAMSEYYGEEDEE